MPYKKKKISRSFMVTGRRKTPLQRSIEQLEEHLDKLKEYTHKLHICGNGTVIPRQILMPPSCG